MSRLRPSDDAWIKTNNREDWRWELEREGALKRWRVRQFVRESVRTRPHGRGLFRNRHERQHR